MPASNAINVYDIYSVSRDERDIGSITNDKYIQSKIRSKILFTKGLSSFDIEVEVFYGEVYLLGLVQSDGFKNALLQLAKDTAGVRKVHEYIRIKQANYPCSSTKILANLKANLFSDSSVKSTNVRIGVVGCDVVFSGIVATHEYEKHAIWYAKHIDGVADVYSFLRVLR
ncbi:MULTISPECIES: BON domain-containing protein [unclassified Campylobacter]|uniref:BON domain-containing protein n=1 Tax=unclassified Campylobacter TaxID=2593542 RepID=UPI003D356896